MPGRDLQPAGQPNQDTSAPVEQEPQDEVVSRQTRGRSPVVATTRDAGPPPERGAAISQAWVWIGVLIAVTILAGLVLIRYRRSVLNAADEAGGGEGILEMLRRARDRGEMTEAEFQVAKKKLVGEMASRMKAGEARKPGR